MTEEEFLDGAGRHSAPAGGGAGRGKARRSEQSAPTRSGIYSSRRASTGGDELRAMRDKGWRRGLTRTAKRIANRTSTTAREKTWAGGKFWREIEFVPNRAWR